MIPGRNTPCPCGSGRKYKHCCGNAARGAGQPGHDAGILLQPSGGIAPAPAAKPAWEIDPTTYEMVRNTMDRAHAGRVVDFHLPALFGDLKIGALDFYPLFRACLEASRTAVEPWKLIRRAERAFNLGRYFLRSLELPGARIECGTYRGFSALLCARIWQSVAPDFKGADFHLVDSFEGLSRPTSEDALHTEELQGDMVVTTYGADPGAMAGPLADVKNVMRDFPGVSFYKGWIPGILGSLPETTWSFVHIDVDLYDPTRGCLEYFIPRMVPGGIIINDDYGSPLFPGSGRAWDEYCAKHHLGFVALDSGQGVLVKEL
jgi:O-methyltransferase